MLVEVVLLETMVVAAGFSVVTGAFGVAATMVVGRNVVAVAVAAVAVVDVPAVEGTGAGMALVDEVPALEVETIEGEPVGSEALDVEETVGRIVVAVETVAAPEVVEAGVCVTTKNSPKRSTGFCSRTIAVAAATVESALLEGISAMDASAP